MTHIDLPAPPAHPDPHAFAWSKRELRAIATYAKAAVLADRAVMAAEVMALRADADWLVHYAQRTTEANAVTTKHPGKFLLDMLTRHPDINSRVLWAIEIDPVTATKLKEHGI